MSKQPIGRNARCPCGSGKKYKQCCMKKDFESTQDEDGILRRIIPITDELGDGLAERMDEMSAELGRELEPSDKLFPDHLEHVEHHMVQAMHAAGVDPALIYAFEETGLIVSEENRDLISDKDYAEWQSAVARYRDKRHPSKQESAALMNDDDEPTPEQAAMVMQMLQSMDPSVASEIFDLAKQCDSADEFANLIMVGPCPKCDSENTGDCEDDPEIDDPTIGRCSDCGHLWCCDCDEEFDSAASAASHDCPFWESLEEDEDFDEPF